ncbi:hypothetical protein MUK42_01909 [Musa troglodytarum]|uniref:Uncharacterized protein n=1 Tax=Musa troglodytarum TaxID=320322 RepID=A0A9E7FEP4_9LILI|nr:hypothetical protein MUK42_01909 [Musa troglodytarum]
MPSIKSFTLEFNNRDTDTHRNPNPRHQQHQHLPSVNA